MTLLLIRHGETPLNVARVLQPPDTPLSEAGRRQAEALAARLADAGLAGILSSDHARARETAQALSRATGLAVRFTSRLQERNFGDWRGQPYDGLGVDPLRMADAPPGGESSAVFEARVAEAFAEALALQATLGGPLAVVTHGLVVRAMLQRHASFGGAPVLPTTGLRNTSISIVGATPPHLCELVDCVQHLDALSDAGPRGLSGG